MALIVLPIVFLLLWIQVWVRRGLLGGSAITRRGAFLLAFLIFETLLLAITELSSTGHQFTRGAVLGSWLFIAGCLLVLSMGTLTKWAPSLLTRGRLRRLTTEAVQHLRTEAAFWLLIPAFYFGVFVYLGLAYLPSNGDSLDYHLVRVMHWIQDRSIAPFPAHFTAQVDYSPLSEYNLAHFHLLYGGDHLDGFVQLFTALVCVVAVSEIARLLGGSSLVQVGAVVICTTIPSLVLSATSTENNLFLASLCVCLVYVLLALSPLRQRWAFAVFVGLAAALAVTTKNSAVTLIGPVAVALVVWRVVTESGVSVSMRTRRWALIAGVGLLIAVIVAGPFLYQDQILFGTPEGPDAQALLSVDLTWRAAGANVVRSVAANFLVGNGQNGPATDSSRFVMERLHDVYDVFGVPQDDVDYALGPLVNVFGAHDFTQWDRDPDQGADPLDVILICFAGVSTLILLLRGDRKLRLVVLISFALTVGFLLSAALSRWQIFGVRLYIPLFVAWSPVIALALARCSRWLLRFGMVVLAVAALPQLLDNEQRPVMRNSYGSNPLAPYFLESTNKAYVVGTARDFEMFSRVLTQSTCRQLGIGNFVGLEYPVWVGLHDAGWNGTIQDVGVENVTSRYESRDFHPCAIITDPGNVPQTGSKTAWVQVSFGPSLSLAIAPEAIRHVDVPETGFTSHVPGLRLEPGSGWTLVGPPKLADTGSVFLFSAALQTVDLRVVGPRGTPQSGVEIESTASMASGGAIISRGTTTSNGTVLVPASGVTRVLLQVAPGVSSSVTGVAVQPATPAPPTATGSPATSPNGQ
jgi:hypothetical protein